METYKQDFIEFMVESGVLTFGDFTTKSGRKTPYFINTGNYRTGEQIRRLGGYYAAAITATFGRDFDVLFGPAYKGIPLAVTASIALAAENDHEIAFCFNRKEVKDHGEGGALVGHKLQDGDRVLIIEDVTTAGTSIRETVPILRAAADIELAGLIISADRMERGTGSKGALVEVGEMFSMPTASIVDLAEIVEHLHNRPVNGCVVLDDELKTRIDAYRAEYGV
ncbi:MAG: orotate phosphoribosyltransferase [Lentisphaerae bacterium]|jgi:orotate phosphoribosyltransferase|nr:orotate phosphoribosyltransferase [Lentisphaerota bacterium]MBT5606513.1 orotate phosphoribosyltransferase [Lentisphaerota bacterium]MBT7060156.1 orotate phosphoribosyltransferase [Lentisphaerota bacterium]MBT7845325.1 orotate phosphoribosyltransferase [Lentisphaerota bacterium]